MLPSLLIGLGNPGASYAKNRHNIGFMAVDEIARRHHFPAFTKKFGGLFAEGSIAEQKIFLLKPLSYMNLSGEPSLKTAGFFKITPSQIIVIHDELDLELGRVRVKNGGGHGGHNGLKSIDAHLGKDYKRVRLGIGHPGHKDLVTNYVLADFAKAEWPIVESLTQDIATYVEMLLSGDDAGFMNKLALSTPPARQ